MIAPLLLSIAVGGFTAIGCANFQSIPKHRDPTSFYALYLIGLTLSTALGYGVGATLYHFITRWW